MSEDGCQKIAPMHETLKAAIILSVFDFLSSLGQIWEAVDPRQDGYVTRDGLYKALALTALAQQGKSISEKALEQFVDSGKAGYDLFPRKKT